MYHITYMSDSYRVKGYLCLPHGSHVAVSQLAGHLEHYYGQPNLPVEQTACSYPYSNYEMNGQKWPVLIYCRGGMGKIGSVKTAWLEQFSKFGHIIFAPCYRGNEGGEGRDQFGGGDQEDVYSAYRWLQSLPFVDADRISVMGFSRGSINAADTAAKFNDVHRLVMWSGVSSLFKTYEERVDMRRMLKRVIGGTPTKCPDSYEERSPICFTERISCPMLVIHGTEDQLVDYSHGSRLYNHVQQQGGAVTLHRYEGYGHHFPPAVHELAINRMFNWIDS